MKLLSEKLQQIDSELKNIGIKPLRIDIGDAKFDSIIWITNDIHIQVGSNFIGVIKKTDRGIRAYSCRNNISLIGKFLYKAVNDEDHGGTVA